VRIRELSISYHHQLAQNRGPAYCHATKSKVGGSPVVGAALTIGGNEANDMRDCNLKGVTNRGHEPSVC
jgi:hypothetical protein